MPVPAKTCAATAPPKLQLFKLSGEGGAEFMHNYVTSNLLAAADGSVSLGACCSRQGRVLADLDLIRIGKQLYLVLLESIALQLERHLAPYLAFSKAKFEICESLALRCVATNSLPDDMPLPSPGRAQKQDSGLIVRYTTSPDWVLCWLPKDHTQVIHNKAALVHWWNAEVQSGRVRITPELTEQFLPQAVGYEALGGISYDKACYLGQEIIARAHYRGALKQSLKKISTTGSWQTDAALKPGAIILNEAGLRTGVVAAISGANTHATLLAVMRNSQSDTSISIENSKLTLNLLE